MGRSRPDTPAQFHRNRRAAAIRACGSWKIRRTTRQCSRSKVRDTLVGRYDPVTEMRPDVDLTQLDLKRSVSRRHAMLTDTGDGFTITEEVGALNGTSVNGSKLVTGKPHPLQEGDVLSFGMVKLIFRAA